jgi:hypothetical protein
MTDEADRTEHFRWLVENRHRNQTCSLQLRLLLREYEKKWKTKNLSVAAQELVSVAFSLWRAVFLAEKTGKRAAVFDDGLKFLERVIEDNSIAYAQDKAMREWSFNYYTKAARLSLEYLHKVRPNISPEYEKVTRTPKERWEYCQELLEVSILQFRKHLEAPKRVKAAGSDAKPAKARPKAQTKANRAIVRNMQLDAKRKSKDL